MRISPAILVIIIVLFGFLTGSSLYFYNKSRVSKKTATQNSETFTAEIPETVDANAPDIVDENTKPAEPKGRPSYPAHTYTVQSGETLFAIGNKFQQSWQQIVLANGLSNENLVQAGSILVIPKLNKNTDYYRVNFVLNDDKLTDLNRELREVDESDQFNPLFVAKETAVPYFNVAESDVFTLIEEDRSAGTALVEAKKADGQKNVIGLIQPKIKGAKGFWVILYVEHHEKE
jgi:LysM repeat protein